MYRISQYVENPFKNEKQVWSHRLLNQQVGLGSESKKLLQDILISPIELRSNCPKEKFKRLMAEELYSRGFLSTDQHSIEQEREDSFLNNPTKLSEFSFYNCPTSHLHAVPESADLVFLGIPSDLGAKKPGCRKGPDILRQRSSAFNFRGENEKGVISLETKSSVFGELKSFDLGDFYFPRASIDDWLKWTERSYDSLPETCIPVSIEEITPFH